MIKECKFCHQEKQHYAKGYCRPCYARYIKRGTPEYYEHPTTSWYSRNKEKALEHQKHYRIENINYYKKYDKEYQKVNKEKITNYKKQWYLKNRERILEKRKSLEKEVE